MIKYKHLFEQGKIGNMPVRNRIVMPPMATCFGSATGEVTDTMIAYYRERAKGGVGLIIVENVQVDYPRGKNIVTQISCDDDRYLPGLNELAEACQQFGARIFAQIHHAGRETAPPIIEGLQPVGASDKPCGFMQVPTKALTTEEVDELVEKFAQGAFRIKRAGFDGVELHGAHGYLIGQFLSPLTNTRNDKYGGSTVKDRCNFVLAIIKRIRELCSRNFPLSVRFSAEEFIKGGNSLEEGIQIAKLLEEAGVDVLHVSSGIYESMCTLLEPMSYPEGWRIYIAEAIKKEVSIPVITVGKIRNPALADSIIEQNKADFVAIGRQLICDPYYPLKAREGREEDIIPCISCNIGCVGGRMFVGRRIRCILNPATGRERDYSELMPATKKKKVMIIGAGPGGMEAARVAALRGHDVTLYEKTGVLGGQLNMAKLPPHKEKIEDARHWFITQIQKAGVKVNFYTEVTPTLIRNVDPDVVVIATGGKPIVPQIPGIENAIPAIGILAGEKQLGNEASIIGGGMVGCETALYLAEKGVKNITVFEQLPELASTVEPMTRIDLLEKMAKAGIKSYTNTLVCEITKNNIMIEANGEKKEIPADTVIFAVGTRPVEVLADQVSEFGKEYYLVGDCRDDYKQTQIMDAVHDGGRVGRLI
ncbi:NAD(P)/FAD-dependent oxidoreductase [Pelotomaculum propionicicum]|uniref:NADH oxidase n=1 Tax=Pelotomaculum propionicicum TaxID=258475 RepID=A0A4Y7RQI5_9FIRM|nr:NAD(P)/FAD-dependent oxidoreductase [Pelotomaculum propionicicum]TEB11274.1 NADH oxidase [Pelotomaculum propionicicum]